MSRIAVLGDVCLAVTRRPSASGAADRSAAQTALSEATNALFSREGVLSALSGAGNLFSESGAPQEEAATWLRWGMLVVNGVVSELSVDPKMGPAQSTAVEGAKLKLTRAATVRYTAPPTTSACITVIVAVSVSHCLCRSCFNVCKCAPVRGLCVCSSGWSRTCKGGRTRQSRSTQQA